MDVLKIDEARILKRIGEIQRRLELLEDFKSVSEEKFLTDDHVSAEAERHLEIAIQACLDISDHLIAKLAFELPKKDKKEVFPILAKHQILPQALVPNLMAMAGLRNVLAHEYLEVERGEIYKTIKNNLGDIVEFIKNIQIFLDKTSDNFSS